MRPLVTIYWARLALGIVAAVISVGIEWARGTIGQFQLNYFLNGFTIALLVYLITYYVIFKAKFQTKVEKQSKLMTMGIGIYFFTWLVSWILLYSIILGPPVPA